MCPIRLEGASPVLECGQSIHIDLRSGAVIIDVVDAIGVGRHTVRLGRTYDSRRRAEPVSLGLGWSLTREGIGDATSKVVHAEGAQLDLRVHENVLAALELRLRRARACVRLFEVRSGRLWRVRDEHEKILEEYDYDGDLLVAARIGDRPTRYFEYDDRGRRARCVRTWSASGARDRMITYAGVRTVVDDATNASWIVLRGPDENGWLDPEMRPVLPSGASEQSSGPSSVCKLSFDASGAISGLEHPTFGAWRVGADVLGRVTELEEPSSQRRIYFRRGAEGVTVQSYRGATLEATLMLDAAMRLCHRHDLRSGITMNARYDADGVLVALQVGDEVAEIENDFEGRATVIRRNQGVEQRVARNRAGEPIAIESSTGRISVEEADELVRAIVDASRELSSTPSPIRVEPRLGQGSEAHLRVVLCAVETLLSSHPPCHRLVLSS